MVEYVDHIGVIDTTHQSIDCSVVKDPCGGEKTRKNPCDRYTYATKRSIAIDTNDIPIECVIGSATRHTLRLLPLTVSSIHHDIPTMLSTMHLDKAYDVHWCDTVLGNYNDKAVIVRKNEKLKCKL